MKSNTNRCGLAPRPGKTMPLTNLFSSTPAILRVLFAGLFALWFIGASAATRYVRAGGSGNGSSWANASGNLQAMINASAAGDQVWVAAGTYKPTTGTDRGISFVMKNGVEILGGFPAAGNPGLAQRDWNANPTILSGDIGTVGNNSDNTYNVVFNDGNGLTNSAVLDGFTVTGGKGVSGFPQSCGGGMFNSFSSPTIKNCTFSNNETPSFGGGMYNQNASPTVTNCIFESNNANAGGGMYNNTSSAPVVTNCIFRENDLIGSNTFGGGMASYGSSPTLRNCTMSGNFALYGGGMYNYGGSNVDVINSIFWGNSSEINDDPGNGALATTVHHSIVQGGFAGTGNLDTDPLFADAAGGDLRLLACSPGIDAGNDADNFVSEDLDGNPREFEAIPGGQMIDMGAYEYQTAVFSGVWHVNAAAATPGSGVSWDCPMQGLQQALAVASSGDQIWVAAGTYKPTAGTDRSISFVMKNGVEILGGFPATGNPGLAERDWNANPTILSGDIGTTGNNSDNSYHVISNYNNGLDNSAVLDGFTITGGYNADKSFPDYLGGGMSNYSASPLVRNCTFSDNTAVVGGGISNFFAAPSVVNCDFSNNSAHSGGGISNFFDSPLVANCIFYDNEASYGGGGIYNANGTPILTNCTLSNNSSANSGGGILSENAAATINNCIVWGNSSGIRSYLVNATVTYTIDQDGHPGTGNLDIDPLFADAANGDFHLLACSPAIDAGSDAANTTANDLDGNARKFEAISGGQMIDMGAFEYQQTVPLPVAECQTFTANLVSNSVIVSAADIDNGSEDDACGPVTLSINGQPSVTYSCSDIGNHTVTLTVYAAQSNRSASCQTTVTVQDNTPPSATCADLAISLDGSGNAAIEPEGVFDGGADACGTVSLQSVTPATFSCQNLGENIVTLTVSDGNGNNNTCSATVTVTDDTLPAITCPNAATVTCSSQIPAVNLNAVTASDNCAAPVKSHLGDATSNQTCANRKTITRTYRATDGSGNSSTCSQVITVLDNVKPNFISVPANVTVQCNSIPAVGMPAASDGCGGSVSIVYNGQTQTNGSCPDTYTLTRQWTATDACGNTQTATQRINVVDTQKPNFTGTPANVTVQCDAVPSVATPTATDNCDTAVAVTYNGQTQTNGACPNAYTLTRTWTAADNCGNTKTVTQRITVVDNGKPVFTAFPANTSISCHETPPTVGSPTASDGCGTAAVTYLGQTTVSGNCPGNYQIKRTWRATDACGNSTVATQTIQVVDNDEPVFTSTPADVTIQCGQPLPPLVTPTASDACGYAFVTFLGNVPSGSGCAADYTVTRTWEAEDLCGNTVSVSQVITVQSNNNAEAEGAENRGERATATLNSKFKIQNSKFKSLNLQPNPTTDRVWLDLTDFAGEAVTVSIFSDLGQLIWERNIPAVEEQKLPVSLREAGAKAGIYSVSVFSPDGVVVKRIVLAD